MNTGFDHDQEESANGNTELDHDQEEPANWNTGFEVIILQYKTCRLNASTFTNPKQSEWVLTSM